MPAEEMDRLIQRSMASSAIGGDSRQQRQGVLSSIAIYLNGIAAVGQGDWTIRQFLDQPGDARLFIVNTDDTKAMFAPLYRLMLSVAFASIASRNRIVHEDRYWFFLDEAPQLGDFGLDDALATLRKYGVCIVTGIQSDAQLVVNLHSQQRADTVMNCLNTALLLQAQESGLQQREARRLGEQEVQTVNRNQALAVTESRDGAGLTSLEANKWVVMPSQFGALAPLTGYLKIQDLPGVFVDYRSWNLPSGDTPPRREAWKARLDMPPGSPAFAIQRPQEAATLDAVRADLVREGQEAEAQGAAVQTAPTVEERPVLPALPALPAPVVAPPAPADPTSVASAPTTRTAQASDGTGTSEAKPVSRRSAGEQAPVEGGARRPNTIAGLLGESAASDAADNKASTNGQPAGQTDATDGAATGTGGVAKQAPSIGALLAGAKGAKGSEGSFSATAAGVAQPPVAPSDQQRAESAGHPGADAVGPAPAATGPSPVPAPVAPVPAVTVGAASTKSGSPRVPGVRPGLHDEQVPGVAPGSPASPNVDHHPSASVPAAVAVALSQLQHQPQLAATAAASVAARDGVLAQSVLQAQMVSDPMALRADAMIATAETATRLDNQQQPLGAAGKSGSAQRAEPSGPSQPKPQAHGTEVARTADPNLDRQAPDGSQQLELGL